MTSSFQIYNRPAQYQSAGHIRCCSQDQTLLRFFALVTDEKMSAKEALQLYRNKDVVKRPLGLSKNSLMCGASGVI